MCGRVIVGVSDGGGGCMGEGVGGEGGRVSVCECVSGSVSESVRGSECVRGRVTESRYLYLLHIICKRYIMNLYIR